MSTPTAENGRPRAAENGRAAGRLERAAGRLALAGFVVYAVAAPHSIAGSWMGLSAAVAGWLVRAALMRRAGIRRTALDLPLWLFVGWTVLSCLLSAEPRESIPKLVNVSTFLVFYLAQSILTRRSAVLVASVLVVSAVAGVLWGVGDLIVGRGVVVTALSSDSPLRAATPLGEGDAVWRVNGRRVASVEEIDDEIRRTPAGGRVSLSVISRGEHVEWPGPEVSEEMRAAPSPSGIKGGGRTHSFRASGFTRHYETFAEQLQIIAQLALGFALAAWRRRAQSREGGGSRKGRSVEERSKEGRSVEGRSGEERGEEGRSVEGRSRRRWLRWRVYLPSLAFVVLAFGLSLTAMRTSTVAFAVGAAVVAYLATPRDKQHVALAVVILLTLSFGGISVWRTRATGALELKDDSASLRAQVARIVARRVWLHPVFGHGMDAMHLHWSEWGFPGHDMLHAHSTPLQLAFDRGLPALLFWLWLMYVFWKLALRAQRMWRETDDAGAHGLALGLAGALAGFLASSLVNYNFGDSEVALLVWWMMGAVVILNEEKVV
ncbi:MAG TPA: O-antigen ligase family protein [Pyrinomonadaceae bacterium]|nr:O-antigen ligase family protein [Pyrinomonadaceae bacterium]